jgi:hypothetical protein
VELVVDHQPLTCTRGPELWTSLSKTVMELLVPLLALEWSSRIRTLGVAHTLTAGLKSLDGRPRAYL